MTYQGVPKMSLVAQYDDLCRNAKVITTGSEEEFKIFVENQLNCMQKWSDTELKVTQLKENIGILESDNKRLTAQMRNLKSLLEDEMNRRKKVEEEKKSMERQISLIKEVLLADGTMDSQTKEKLAFLSTTNSKMNFVAHPLASLCNIHDKSFSACTAAFIESGGSLLSISDEDQTGDDLDTTFIQKNDSATARKQSPCRRNRHSKGKRSSSESRFSSRRKKSRDNTENIEATDLPENGDLPFKKTRVQCNSEPTSNSPEVPSFPHQIHKSDSDQSKYNTYHLRRRNVGNMSEGTPVGRYSTGGKLSRTHAFVTKTVIRTEKCFPCGRIIKFCKQALKCQDCRAICHPECKEQCPVPCIPTVNTPTKGTTGTIADFVSSTPPMIPSLIVHCVNEIEARGFCEIGLYRISGSEREVKDLKEKFLRGRTIPCLNQVDINAICGLIKEFLRSLQEPLITRFCWQAFVDAAEVSDKTLSLKTLYEAVVGLPQPNRDTLAFLILHLQRIAESPDCKMPKENLAKVFGPTIVGYSVSDPAEGNMLNETSHQYNVMLHLLEISADSWQNLLNFETDVFQNTFIKTPETLPAPRNTRLGPIYTPGQKPQNSSTGRTSLAQRNSKFSKSMRVNFSSPHLK